MEVEPRFPLEGQQQQQQMMMMMMEEPPECESDPDSVRRRRHKRRPCSFVSRDIQFLIARRTVLCLLTVAGRVVPIRTGADLHSII